MTQALRQIVLGLATTGLLMGCVDGAGGIGGGATPAAAARGTAAGGGPDEEAPEIFQTTASALWDGRPSLGGIWVASPEAEDPERVVMVNPATGMSVTGALFRRERDNPGPSLQLSSDAAEALGMLAGQPAELRVTALRRAEAEAPPVEVAETDLAEVPPAVASNNPVATAAVAAAALDAADAGTAEAAPEARADAATAAVEEPPRRKTWKERRAEAKAAREAKRAAATVAVVADTPVPPEGLGITEIETAPLDGGTPDAAAAPLAEASPAPDAAPIQPAPPLTRREKRAAAEAAAETAAAAAPVDPAAADPVATGRPIQIASFTKEENAARAVEALVKIGVSAQSRKSESNGKAVWGVVARGDAAMLQTIISAGFADAYFLQ